MRSFVWLWLCLCCTVCAQQPELAHVRILFVGNSLTYANNLPQLVTKVGARNDIHIQTDMLAYSNYALEDHWSDGELQSLIANGDYDYVVVQQGPSSQADGKAMLLEYGEQIKSLCDKQNTKLAFYMVWPARINYHTFTEVIANYSLAASHTKSILCPVGTVWKGYIDSTQDFSYYDSDGFHPSLAGSQLAAEIIFESLSISK